MFSMSLSFCRNRSQKAVIIGATAAAAVFGLAIASAPAVQNAGSGASGAEARPELVLQVGHSIAVKSFALSPDETLLATGGVDRTAKLWDARTGELRATLVGHSAPVDQVVFSPDGALLATGAGESGNDGVLLWDARTGQRKHTFKPMGPMAFSPDGKTLAIGGWAGGVRIWDVQTGAVRRTIPSSLRVGPLAYSPDGKALAGARTDAAVTVWNAETGAPLGTLKTGDMLTASLAFSPEGDALATGGGDLGSGVVRLWNARTGMLVRTLNGHHGAVLSLTFSPDGKTLASSTFAMSISLEPGGDETADEIKFWDVATGTQRRTLKAENLGDTVTFSSDGKTFITSGGVRFNRDVKMWDAQTGKLARTLPLAQADVAGSIVSLAPSPDGKALAGGTGDPFKLRDVPVGTIRLWDLGTGQLTHTLSEHQGSIRALAFSPDGKTLASGSQDATVKLWDGQTGTRRRTLTGRDKPVWSVAFAPGGKALAAGCGEPLEEGNQPVVLWGLTTPAPKPGRTLSGHLSLVTCVAFSPSGQIVATGSSDQTGRLWDVRTGKTLGKLICAPWGSLGRPQAFYFSPDGKTVAAAGVNVDKRPVMVVVRTWGVGTGAPKALATRTLASRGPGSLPSSDAVFSPDGKRVAVGIGDGTVQAWDLPSGKFLWSLPHYAQSVCFSPDGTRVMTGGLDNAVKVWDAGNGRLLATLMVLPPNAATGEDAASTNWIAFTSEGYYLCSPGAARFIRWRVGDHLFPAGKYERAFHCPDAISKALRGEEYTPAQEPIPPQT